MIELLVVVAIIMILIALLAPSFSPLNEYVRVIVCKNRVHQLMIGVIRYSSDHEGALTPHRYWVANSAWTDPTHVQQGLIWTYTQETELYRCPSFLKAAEANGYLTAGVTAYRTYSMSWNIADTDGWGHNDGTLSRSIQTMRAIGDAAELLCLTEENPWTPTYDPATLTTAVGYYTLNDGSMCASDWPNRDTLATYHFPVGGDVRRGLSVCGFMDGNVRMGNTMDTRAHAYQNVFPKPKWRY